MEKYFSGNIIEDFHSGGRRGGHGRNRHGRRHHGYNRFGYGRGYGNSYYNNLYDRSNWWNPYYYWGRGWGWWNPFDWQTPEVYENNETSISNTKEIKKEESDKFLYQSLLVIIVISMVYFVIKNNT